MAMDLEQAYAYATDFMAGAIQREDAQAGIDAFAARSPNPTGRAARPQTAGMTAVHGWI
jgi:hypothetical protein